MVRSAALILIVALVLTASTGCKEEEPVYLGDPGDKNVAKVAADNIGRLFFNYLGSNLETELTMVAQRFPSPNEGFSFLEARSEFGTVWILAETEKWGDLVSKMKRGDILKVFGTVGSVKLGEGMKSEIAITVH
jgi:hypothetical protein